MQTLFDNVVEDFATADPSEGRVVSRAARRLVERGFVVVLVTQIEHSTTRFQWGEKSFGKRQKRIWRITFLVHHEQKLVHQGHLDIREHREAFSACTINDRAIKPPPTIQHFFVPDCSATERLLRRKTPIAPGQRTIKRKGRPALVLDRIRPLQRAK